MNFKLYIYKRINLKNIFITLGLRFPKYRFVVFGSPESNDPLISSGSTIIKSKNKNIIIYYYNYK